MELDELKILLRSKQHISPEKSATEIHELLGKKTSGVLDKIKRSLWKELIMCLVFTVTFILVAVFTNYSSVRVYFLIFSFLCVPFFPVLWFLLKKLNRLTAETLPVKSNLEEMLAILTQYVKIYFRLTMALIPVAVLFSLWLGFQDEQINDTLSLLTGKTVIFIIVYLGVFSTAMYYFTRWYLKKLYGNYLEQLKSLIKELEE